MKPFPNSDNPNDPTSDEMAAYIVETWKKYKSFHTWPSLFRRNMLALLRVVAVTGCGIMSAAAALYEIGLREEDEGPERWLAVGYEMYFRQQSALMDAAHGLRVDDSDLFGTPNMREKAMCREFNDMHSRRHSGLVVDQNGRLVEL